MYTSPTFKLEPRASIAYQEAHPNDTQVPNLIAATVICLIAAWTAVALRFISRHIGRIKFGKDDFFIIVALIIGSAYSILMVTTTRFGFGKHAVYVSIPNETPLGKGTWAALCILPSAVSAVKLSLLFLYKRIFEVRTGFVKLLIGMGLLIAAWWIACTFSTIFECLPVGAQDQKNVPHHCFNEDLQFSILSFFNVAFDIILLCMPLPLIWQLHTNTKRKVQLMAMFMVGTITCIASLTRSIYSLNTSRLDPTWNDVPTVMWTTVEVQLSIVSACLATLRPLLRRLSRGKEDHSLPHTLDVNRTRSIPSKRSNDTELGTFVSRDGKEDDHLPFAGKGAMSPVQELHLMTDVHGIPTRRGVDDGV